MFEELALCLISGAAHQALADNKITGGHTSDTIAAYRANRVWHEFVHALLDLDAVLAGDALIVSEATS